MKKFILSILVASSCLFYNNAVAQATQSKYQALFMYNFTKYMEWPEKQKITIGVMGNSPVLLELQKIAKRANTNFAIVKVAAAADVEKCDMIFLPEAQTRNFQLIQESIGMKDIILIAEDSNLARKGAEVGFYLESSKLKFVLNTSEIQKTQVKVSQGLFSIAKVI